MEVRGFPVEALLIEERLDIAREVFISTTYDNMAKTAILLLSTEGGIEVESAEEVIRHPFSLATTFPDYLGRQLAARLGFTGQANLRLGRLITQVANTFSDFDALLLGMQSGGTDARWTMVGG